MVIARNLSLALDPVLFARSIGIEPDPWQQDVLRDESGRQLLLCSRQSGKSTTAAIRALHRAVFNERSLILLISPSQRQSSELFRTVGDLRSRIEHAPPLIEDNRLSLTMENGSRIVSLPSSEATIRGYAGASLIIEDEAARVPDDLNLAVRPMLATSNGQLILMSTAWGKRGHFYDAWENGGDAWQRVKVTADMCPRIPPQFLAEERRSIGELWYRSEYECEFADTVTSVFRSEDIERAITSEITPLFGGLHART